MRKTWHRVIAYIVLIDGIRRTSDITGALLGLPTALVITAGICGSFTVYHGQGVDYYANCIRSRMSKSSEESFFSFVSIGMIILR